MDEDPKVVAAKPAAKGPSLPDRQPIEHWIGQKAIAGYEPGTLNHTALMAGVHAELGRVQELLLTEEEFDAAVAEFLGTNIGYRVLGAKTGGVK